MLHWMIVCELDQAADGIHFDRLDQNKTNICILQVTRNCPPPSPPIVFKAQGKEMHASEKWLEHWRWHKEEGETNHKL